MNQAVPFKHSLSNEKYTLINIGYGGMISPAHWTDMLESAYAIKHFIKMGLIPPISDISTIDEWVYHDGEFTKSIGRFFKEALASSKVAQNSGPDTTIRIGVLEWAIGRKASDGRTVHSPCWEELRHTAELAFHSSMLITQSYEKQDLTASYNREYGKIYAATGQKISYITTNEVCISGDYSSMHLMKKPSLDLYQEMKNKVDAPYDEFMAGRPVDFDGLMNANEDVLNKHIPEFHRGRRR